MVVIEVVEDINSTTPNHGNNCPICLDSNPKNIWKCKQCNTVFHKKCIKQWDLNNNNYPYYSLCPVCRLEYSLCNWKCICYKMCNYNYYSLLTFAYLISILIIIIVAINVSLLLYIFITFLN